MGIVITAKIEDGMVVNISKFHEGVKLPKDWVECSGDVGIGWAYDGSKFIKPVVIVADLTQEEINSKSHSYLRLTDWYIIREIETGINIPTTITKNRTDARSAIVEN